MKLSAASLSAHRKKDNNATAPKEAQPYDRPTIKERIYTITPAAAGKVYIPAGMILEIITITAANAVNKPLNATFCDFLMVPVLPAIINGSHSLKEKLPFPLHQCTLLSPTAAAQAIGAKQAGANITAAATAGCRLSIDMIAPLYAGTLLLYPPIHGLIFHIIGIHTASRLKIVVGILQPALLIDDNTHQIVPFRISLIGRDRRKCAFRTRKIAVVDHYADILEP